MYVRIATICNNQNKFRTLRPISANESDKFWTLWVLNERQLEELRTLRRVNGQMRLNEELALMAKRNRREKRIKKVLRITAVCLLALFLG